MRYSFAPTFGSHESTTWSFASSECAPAGSPIVRVNVTSPENGPGTTLPTTPFGKFARTRQRNSPVPVMDVAVSAGMRIPLRSLCVPSDRSTETSYETAPGTGAQDHVGIWSPVSGFVGLGTGAGKVRRKVAVGDHESPTWFSSFARTRQ